MRPTKRSVVTVKRERLTQGGEVAVPE